LLQDAGAYDSGVARPRSACPLTAACLPSRHPGPGRGLDAAHRRPWAEPPGL